MGLKKKASCPTALGAPHPKKEKGLLPPPPSQGSFQFSQSPCGTCFSVMGHAEEVSLWSTALPWQGCEQLRKKKKSGHLCVGYKPLVQLCPCRHGSLLKKCIKQQQTMSAVWLQCILRCAHLPQHHSTPLTCLPVRSTSVSRCTVAITISCGALSQGTISRHGIELILSQPHSVLAASDLNSKSNKRPPTLEWEQVMTMKERKFLGRYLMGNAAAQGLSVSAEVAQRLGLGMVWVGT